MCLGSHYNPGYSQDSNRAGVGAIFGFGGGGGGGLLRNRGFKCWDFLSKSFHVRVKICVSESVRARFIAQALIRAITGLQLRLYLFGLGAGGGGLLCHRCFKCWDFGSESCPCHVRLKINGFGICLGPRYSPIYSWGYNKARVGAIFEFGWGQRGGFCTIEASNVGISNRNLAMCAIKRMVLDLFEFAL